MKILYHHRIASKDGQYVHIQCLTSALRKLGHDVIVVGPRFIDGGTLGSGSGLIDFLKRTIPRAIYELLELAYNLRDYVRLARAVKVYRPDIIYERYNLYLLSGIWAMRRFKLPLISEVNAPLYDERSRYGGIALKRLARAAERASWRGADRVVTVTSVLRSRIIDAVVDANKIVVTPNGVDLDQFPEGPARAAAKRRLGLGDKLVLGFVGFAREWHGLDRVLDLLAAERARNLHFLVVGDGDVRESLERFAADKRLQDRFRITGFVERDEVTRYVQAFDIALQPAVVDYASPLKLFEYMACGAAIVAPDKANIREILTHDRDALLFDPADPVQFTAAVARLCQDADLRATLGRQARQTLLERDLTWDHNARTVTAIAGELRAGCDREPRCTPEWRNDHV